MLGLRSKRLKTSPFSPQVQDVSALWIDTAPISVALVDSGGLVLKSSPVWKQQTELSQLPAPNIQGEIEDLQTASKRWLRLNLHPADDGNRLCVATDVSDLKTDYYRQILDTFQDCVKVLDTQGRLLFLNTAGRAVLHVAPDQPLGMLWTDLLPPTIHDKINQIIEQVVSGETARFSNQSQLAGHESETWQHTLMPYSDVEGRVIAILCMSRNITADYKNQQTTRINEERLVLAAQVAGLGIWDLDLETGRVHVNDTWYNVMDIASETAIATVGQFLNHVHPDDIERMRQDWLNRDTIIENVGEYKTTVRRVANDGQILNIRIAGALVRDIADQPIRAIGFVSRIETA